MRKRLKDMQNCCERNEKLFEVMFLRRDGKQNELYYYRTLSEAQYHLQLFLRDDSNLYSSIVLSEITDAFQTKKEIDASVFQLDERR